MSQTAFLKEEEPLDREQSVESYLKTRLQNLDKAIAGYTTLSLAGLSGNLDLSPATAKHRRLKLTGNPAGAVTLRIPHTTGANADIHFVNACGGSFSTLTVKSTGANVGNAAGVVIPTSFCRTVGHDGESAYPMTLLLTLAGEVPSARAYHSAAQAVPHNTWTVQSLNSELYDTAAMHDPATNNSRLTCKASGLYSLSAAAQIGGNATGARFIQLLLNGTTEIKPSMANNAGAAQAVYLSVDAHYRLAAGDYVEVRLYQDSGVSLNTVAATVSLSMAQIGG